MRGLAAFRVGLGSAAWFAPGALARIFGVPADRVSPELEYMNRVFGVRAVALGVGYLASSGKARDLWHRLWLLCDTADTAMGMRMVGRGELGGFSAAAGLATTAGAMAIDVAVLASRRRSS